MTRAFILTILLLFLTWFSIAAPSKWQKFYRKLQVPPRQFKGVDFSTEALRVRYLVTCSRTCDIFFMTFPEFRKFQQKQIFTYLRFHPNVTSDKAQWSARSDIKQRLIVIAINRDYRKHLTAKFYMQQEIVTHMFNKWLLLLIILGCCSPCIFIACLIALCKSWMGRQIIGYRSRHYYPIYDDYYGTTGGYPGTIREPSREESEGGNVVSGTI